VESAGHEVEQIPHRIEQWQPVWADRPFGNAPDPRSMARQIVPNAGEKVYQFRLTEKGSEAPAYFHASAPIYVSALPRCSNRHINLKFSIKRAASLINRPIFHHARNLPEPRTLKAQRQQKGEAMGNLLYWAVVFLVIALVAAVLGFGGVAGTAMAGAQMLFWVAIVLFVISLIWGLLARGRI
jgi:uncharacterized membrane protein YtjA (UPF0391 family)